MLLFDKVCRFFSFFLPGDLPGHFRLFYPPPFSFLWENRKEKEEGKVLFLAQYAEQTRKEEFCVFNKLKFVRQKREKTPTNSIKTWL